MIVIILELLKVNSVELSKSDYETIYRMEQFQKNKNIEDQHIYNKIRTASMKKTLDKLKNRPDSSFLENLPHLKVTLLLRII